MVRELAHRAPVLVATAQAALGAEHLAERVAQLLHERRAVGRDAAHAAASSTASAGTACVWCSVLARRSTTVSTIVGSSATTVMPMTHQ